MKKKNIFFLVGGFPPIKMHPGSGNLFLGLVDPSWKRLASTAYLPKPGFSVLHDWWMQSYNMKINKKFKSCQIYNKDPELGGSKEKLNFRFFSFLFFVSWSLLYSNHLNFQWIFAITRKLKIGKLVFHSIQQIAHLSWKFEHFRRIFFVKNFIVDNVNKIDYKYKNRKI